MAAVLGQGWKGACTRGTGGASPARHASEQEVHTQRVHAGSAASLMRITTPSCWRWYKPWRCVRMLSLHTVHGICAGPVNGKGLCMLIDTTRWGWCWDGPLFDTFVQLHLLLHASAGAVWRAGAGSLGGRVQPPLLPPAGALAGLISKHAPSFSMHAGFAFCK